MRISSSVSLGLGLLLAPMLSHAQLLDKVELEDGTLLGSYTSLLSSPFTGIAVYSNGDGVDTTAMFSDVPGIFRVDIQAASSNTTSAGISVYLNDKRLGTPYFAGTTPSVQSIQFRLEEPLASDQLRFVLETDNGSNNTFVDWYELHRVGDIPPPPPPPVLPSTGAYDSGVYRNMFAEMGIPAAEVQARVEAVYDQLFHSSDLESEAIFIPVGTDMAYIWDTGNNDVRSEGMSYGMMMAVQMDRQEDFDKLWKWAHTYSLNKTGDMKGYFAWQVTTEGQIRDSNPAPDGEVYFATALFFASNRWGDKEGIFNYREQANQILDDMFDNGQTRYANGGILESFSLFDHDEKKIVFSPATPSDRNWTDPSYHLPAFFDLWALWADSNNAFWAEVAESSRDFLKTTVHPETGLNPDYAYFDGSPHGDFQHWKDTFQYDAWRTVGNAAMDTYWWNKDSWQTTYANTLQTFFKSEGIDSYSSLYELNGVPYENNADHSPGLVAMNAVASLAADDARAWEFVQAFWDTPAPTGRYRYYDGSLYMFGMLALSGNYNIYCPNDECTIQQAEVSKPASSSSSSSSSLSSSSSSSSTSSASSLSSSSTSSSSIVSSSSSSSSSSSASSVASSASSSSGSDRAAGGLDWLALLALTLLPNIGWRIRKNGA